MDMITEDKVLIAMYTGDEYIKGSDSWIYKMPDERSYRSWRSSELRYDIDWNWLIPVVKAVNYDMYIEIQKDEYAVRGWPHEYILRVCKKQLEKGIQHLSIEELYTATVEAIKLLNKIKQCPEYGYKIGKDEKTSK